jgi:hypothetical protein
MPSPLQEAQACVEKRHEAYNSPETYHEFLDWAMFAKQTDFADIAEGNGRLIRDCYRDHPLDGEKRLLEETQSSQEKLHTSPYFLKSPPEFQERQLKWVAKKILGSEMSDTEEDKIHQPGESKEISYKKILWGLGIGIGVFVVGVVAATVYVTQTISSDLFILGPSSQDDPPMA